MPSKQVIGLEAKRDRGVTPRFLIILGAIVLAAFLVLLLVGFENVLALFRYRVTLFLVLGPVLLVFVWCIWKALRPRG